MPSYCRRLADRYHITALSAGLLALCFSLNSAFAQGTRSDYERARNLRTLTRDKVTRTRIQPHWVDESSAFWYRNDLGDGKKEFVLVEPDLATRQPAFDHARFAEALAQKTGKKCDASKLPLDSIEFDDTRESIFFRVEGKKLKCVLRDYTIEDDIREEPSKDESPSQTPPRGRRGMYRPRSSHNSQKSPDGQWAAMIKDHNVWLRVEKTGEEFALSTEGNESDGYESRFYWSPDSKKLVALRRAKGEEHKVYMVESSPKDQLQPKLHSMDYHKPGDKLPVTKPHLFDVAARKEIPVSDQLFTNPWSIRDFRWGESSRRFTFLYNQRGHQVLRVLAVDAATGEVGTIIDEQSKTFIDYAGKQFVHYVDKTHEVLWMSERDGWNHLYMIDARTGQVKKQITQGPWVVRRIDHVDEENREIWFQAGGIYPEQDPYYVHYCRASFDGTNLVVMTDGNGTHSVTYSPDRKYLIDTYSRVDMAPVSEVRRTSDGKLVCDLEKGDLVPLTATGWKAPERFVAKGRDGQTDIYGVIHRPTTFDPEKKYPVIELIYAGPHGSFVPKAFRPCHGAQITAELGFIVVQIDGMGTSHRSKAFHDVCWRNLGDSGFPDRILWMRAAAKKYPYMDLSRVGIYGGSAGGQSSTRAMLAHGDFYKVAVSDCGCHDNRMDKVWWNELWMGWPIGPHYEEQSNVTQAHKLQGKLLLIVGELDRNVDPASTMQVVNALIKADKDFDMLVVPGGGHGIAEAPYGYRRRQDYFVRHLLGVEPRSQP